MPETAETTPAPEFFADLAKAQNEFAPVRKNRVNPFLKNKYADLQSVLDAVKPALNAHGFFLFQRVTCECNAVGVETFVGRGTEQLSSGVFTVPYNTKDSNVAQALGSARTYACRYSLCSFLCVAADDDDDGNASNAQAPQQAPRRPVASQALKEESAAEAAKGMAAYKAYFDALNNDTRRILTSTGLHNTNKAAAKAVDAGATA